MLRSALRQTKIRICKLVIGKRTLRVMVQYAAGSQGLLAYNRFMDLVSALMGSSREADKLLCRIRDIFVECVVLASEDGFDRQEIRSMEVKVTNLVTKLENKFPKSTQALEFGHAGASGDDEKFAETVKPIQELISEVTTTLVEGLGTSLAPATVQKLQRISQQLSQPKVLEQICNLDSRTHAIFGELYELASTSLQPIMFTTLQRRFGIDMQN